MEKDDLTMENADAAPEKGMRLGKYLAMAGIGSRRSCEGYIQEGRVTVNGEAVTEPGTCVTEADDVRFEGKPISLADRTKVYLMLNKPVGFTCSARDVHAKNLVYQLIPERFGRIFTVGRLDRDSEGLLILTNDGEFAQRLTHPSHQIYKRYYVECGGRYTTSVRRKLMDGMYDNGEFLQALNVEQLSVQHGFCKLIFTMGEGRKREVRRLCKDVGLRVELLRRVGVGQLELDPQLTPGSWRIMSPRDCELALQPIAVPERPRSAEPPKPYWVKEEPEEMTARKPRAAGGREGVRRGRGGETEDGRRPGRKPARPRQPEAPERRRPWYEPEDDGAPFEERADAAPRRRPGRKPARPRQPEAPERRRPWYEPEDDGAAPFGERADAVPRRQPGRKPARPRQPEAPERRRPWYEPEDDGAPFGERADAAPRRRPGRKPARPRQPEAPERRRSWYEPEDDGAAPFGERADAAPRRQLGRKPKDFDRKKPRRAPENPPKGGGDYRRNKPPRSWR